MKILKFTSRELRALKQMIMHNNSCRGGCVFREMTKSKNKSCEECDFTKSINSILNKIT